MRWREILAHPLSREYCGTKFLKHARRFVDATGRLPRHNEVVGESKVGLWLVTRRAEAKNGTLSQERIQLIKAALGPDAVLHVTNVDFERNLADIAEHRRLHGNFPTRYRDGHLGTWLMNRRKDVNDGSLSEAHKQRLDTVLGAEWRPKFKNAKVRHPRNHLMWQHVNTYARSWQCLRMCWFELAYHGMCVCL